MQQVTRMANATIGIAEENIAGGGGSKCNKKQRWQGQMQQAGVVEADAASDGGGDGTSRR